MACRAAAFVFACPFYCPISRKDIIRTPSQTIKIWNRLSMTIVIKIVNRYLMHKCRFWSECMSHVENSKIGHMTDI